jgi:hypothetical protein
VRTSLVHLTKKDLKARRGFDKHRRAVADLRANRARRIAKQRALSRANSSSSTTHSLSISPSSPPLTSIRVGHCNIGGIKLHEGYIVQHLLPHFDVCVLTETKASDLDYFKYLRATYKWRVLHVARPRTLDSSGKPSDAQGGVAVIIFTPTLAKMQLIHADPLGLLSVDVSPANPSTRNFKPFNLIGTYLPNVYNSNFKDHTPIIISAISHLLCKAAPVYGNHIIICGDFNSRIGPVNPCGTPRYTMDERYASNVPCLQLRSLLKNFQLVPTHGRSSYDPANVTSREVGDNGKAPLPGYGAEVDYLFTHSSLTTFTTITTLPSWEFNPYTSTHIPLGINFFPQGSTASSNSIALPKKRWTLPHYNNHAAWELVGKTLLDKLNEYQVSSQDNAQASYDSFIAAFNSALDSSTPFKPPPITTPSQRKISASIKSRALPPHVRALIQSRMSQDPQSSSYTAATTAIRRAIRKVRRVQERSYIKDLEILRINSSKLFFAHVAKNLAPANPTLSAPPTKNNIPDEPGHPPAPQRMTEWYKSLLGVEQPVPPAVNDPFWHQFISPHPLPVIQSLGRDFSPEEILRVIFPTTNYNNFKCPSTGIHDPHCTLCNTLKEQAAAWTGPDDLHNTPPSHFPSGKAQPAAAGEDILAYIRWVRHPDTTISKYQFRMNICNHLAPVLSHILREGRMPDGTLDYRSIPLPKPSTDPNANYADPSKLYRFLAMAPLLTKVLGLALDARFIHWATKNDHIDVSFQGASMPYLDTEHLPLHFMECIKAMWDKKLSVASIFVDLKKAYDMVHPQLM